MGAYPSSGRALYCGSTGRRGGWGYCRGCRRRRRRARQRPLLTTPSSRHWVRWLPWSGYVGNPAHPHWSVSVHRPLRRRLWVVIDVRPLPLPPFHLPAPPFPPPSPPHSCSFSPLCCRRRSRVCSAPRSLQCTPAPPRLWCRWRTPVGGSGDDAHGQGHPGGSVRCDGHRQGRVVEEGPTHGRGRGGSGMVGYLTHPAAAGVLTWEAGRGGVHGKRGGGEAAPRWCTASPS